MARIISAFLPFLDGAGNPLINGKIRFTEAGTNNTDKNTFYDVNLTAGTENTNPVILDGNGKCPDVFGSGVYRAVLLDSNDQPTGESYDPVGSVITPSQWMDWQGGTTYPDQYIVTASDKGNYRSIAADNLDYNPTTSTTKWEKLQIGRIWNANVVYIIGNNAFGAGGDLYKSLTNSNSNNNPDSDDGTNWLQISANTLENSGVLFAYSAAATMPGNGVVTMNPASAGLVVTLTTTDTGDIKRLINISAYPVLVKLTGTGFLTVAVGATAFVMKVGGDWYAVSDANDTLPASLLALGTAGVFNSAATTYISITKVTDTKIAIAYEEGTVGSCIIGDIASGSITFGTEVAFNAAAVAFVAITRMTDTQICIAYEDDDKGQCVIGTISGNAVSFVSEVTFNTDNSEHIAITSLTATKFCIAYQDYGPSGNPGRVIIGDISGTSVTFGSPATFSTSDSREMSITALTSSKIAVSSLNSSTSKGDCRVATVSGTSFTFGTSVVFNAASSRYTAIKRVTDTTCVIAYNDAGSSGHGTAIVGTVSGTSISFGSETVFNAATTEGVSLDLIASGVVILAYRNNAVPNGSCIIGTVSGTGISFGGAVIFDADNIGYSTVATTSDNNFVIAYQDVGNSNYGTAIAGTRLTA